MIAGIGQQRPAATQLALWVVIGAAWLVAIAAQLTGAGELLHHHTLLGDGPPILLAAVLFTASWQLMVAGMMLPASLPAIAAYEAATASRTWVGSLRAAAPFLGAYFLAWSVFGLCCFAGDFLLHQVVNGSPWLAQRPWLIEAGVVGLAGVYQFLPLKHRFLAECRHTAISAHADRAGLAAGAAHAADCLVSSGPLMLLMFAMGFSGLWWMIGLTLLMTYEARGRFGHEAAYVSGTLLLALATVQTLSHGLPG